jgi:hypothetical protein
MTARWTEADYQQAMRKNHPAFQARKRSKYGAVKTTVDGYVFDSKREAARYAELRLRERAGEIQSLERQVPYPIRVTNLGTGEVHTVGTYVADFRYWPTTKTPPFAYVVEDVKSEPTKTPVYRLKKKLVEALYGIQITEVV